MSLNRDCPSCATGSHDRHDPDHGVIEGCIGGTSCGCTGDCPERRRAESEEFAKWWGGLEVKALDPVHLMRSDGSMPTCPLNKGATNWTARPEDATCPRCTS